MEIHGQLSAIILPVQEEDIVELVLGSVHYNANYYRLLVHHKCALPVSI